MLLQLRGGVNNELREGTLPSIVSSVNDNEVTGFVNKSTLWKTFFATVHSSLPTYSLHLCVGVFL